MPKWRSELVGVLVLTLVFSLAPAFKGISLAQTGSTKDTKDSKSTSAKTTDTKAPTDKEIADAKVKGMVWVNTSSKVYHKESSKYYGKTKHGKFMSEDEAKKAGNHEAKSETAST